MATVSPTKETNSTSNAPSAINMHYRADASPEQSSRQQRLHVPPAVGDEITVDAPPGNPVNHAVWPEKRLTVLTNTESQEFLRVRTALRVCGEAFDCRFPAFEHMDRLGRIIVLIDVIVYLLEVPRRIRGQQHLEPYQPFAFFSRMRLNAVLGVTTRPSSIWRLPRARIFSSATVSWVSS